MHARTLVKVAVLALLIPIVGSMAWPGLATAQLPARVFTVPPNTEIHLASGSGQWCVNVEPVSGDFTVTDINACTVQLSSPGTGSVSSITFDCSKGAIVGDADGNGVTDIQFCFLKTAMQPLFDHLHGNKPKTVTLTVTGNLITGGSFSGSITLLLYLNS